MKISNLVYLFSVYILYSISTIAIKFSSKYPIFTIPFCAYILLSFLLLCAYAFFWQRILKKTSLFSAYAAKGIVVVYGFIFGKLIFNEVISIQAVIASILVIIGIYMVVSDEH